MLNLLKNGEVIRQVFTGSRLDIPEDKITVTPAEAGWSYGDYELVEAPPPEPEPEPEPPTPEEIRANMPTLTARQLRLGLVGAGFSLAQVDAALDAIEDEQAKAVAEIEWQYATQFERMHPLIAQVGGAFGLTPEQIDGMWQAAMEL